MVFSVNNSKFFLSAAFQLSRLVFKDTSIDAIILSLCKCLCSEYLLVTKPLSFSFINSHALLKTHAACSRFFASKRRAFGLHVDGISSTFNHLSLYALRCF